MHLEIDKISLEDLTASSFTGFAGVSFKRKIKDVFKINDPSLGPKEYNADILHINKNYTPPVKGPKPKSNLFISLSRVVTSEDLTKMELSTMPGFRLTWYYSGMEVKPEVQYENLQFVRLVNILLTTNLDTDTIWNAVKKVKQEISTADAESCETNCLYSDSVQVALVKAVENQLGVEFSEQRFKNTTVRHLEKAAEMFIYLNSCPGSGSLKLWFKSWSSFYDDLFRTKPPDEIILTLNRMMKNKSLEGEGPKLFRKTAALLSLKYEKIQNMFPKVQQNSFSKTDNYSIGNINNFVKEGNKSNVNVYIN